jgi:hypothetical protein
LISIIVFLPEMLRSIAGNGELRLTGIHQPLIRRIAKEPPALEERDDIYNPPKVAAKEAHRAIAPAEREGHTFELGVRRSHLCNLEHGNGEHSQSIQRRFSPE